MDLINSSSDSDFYKIEINKQSYSMSSSSSSMPIPNDGSNGASLAASVVVVPSIKLRVYRSYQDFILFHSQLQSYINYRNPTTTSAMITTPDHQKSSEGNQMARWKVPAFPYKKKKAFLSLLVHNHTVQLQHYLIQLLSNNDEVSVWNNRVIYEFFCVRRYESDEVWIGLDQQQQGNSHLPEYAPSTTAEEGTTTNNISESEYAARLSQLADIASRLPSMNNGQDEISTTTTTTTTLLNQRQHPVKNQAKKCLDDYELIKVLGKGCMGKVLLSRERRTGRIYAIKSISKQWVLAHGPREIEHIKSEQKILATLSCERHPFLVHLHCSFQSPESLFLVLEYISGGDLATQLALYGRFDAKRTLFYTAEIVSGVRELHRMGIIYRDLKPENVLLDHTGHIKLTDFGLSKQFKVSHKLTHSLSAVCTNSKDCECNKTVTRTFCGTAEYLAPEILLERPYGFEVDWWSLGTFLYEMIAGTTPFYADNHAEMYRRVIEDDLKFPDDFNGDIYTRDLITRLLIRDPQTRGWSVVLGNNSNNNGGANTNSNPLMVADGIMQHGYFRHVNWHDLLNGRIMAPYVPQVRNPLDAQWFDEAFTRMTPRISPCPINQLLIPPPQQQLNNAIKNKSVNNVNNNQSIFNGYSWNNLQLYNQSS